MHAGEAAGNLGSKGSLWWRARKVLLIAAIGLVCEALFYLYVDGDTPQDPVGGDTSTELPVPHLGTVYQNTEGVDGLPVTVETGPLHENTEPTEGVDGLPVTVETGPLHENTEDVDDLPASVETGPLHENTDDVDAATVEAGPLHENTEPTEDVDDLPASVEASPLAALAPAVENDRFLGAPYRVRPNPDPACERTLVFAFERPKGLGSLINHDLLWAAYWAQKTNRTLVIDATKPAGIYGHLDVFDMEHVCPVGHDEAKSRARDQLPALFNRPIVEGNNITHMPYQNGVRNGDSSVRWFSGEVPESDAGLSSIRKLARPLLVPSRAVREVMLEIVSRSSLGIEGYLRRDYVALHVRGGDKLTQREALPVGANVYLDAVVGAANGSGTTNVFVMSNSVSDPVAVSVKDQLARLNFSVISDNRMVNYESDSAYGNAPEELRERGAVALFAEICLAVRARRFIGTWTSNVGRLVLEMREDDDEGDRGLDGDYKFF